jgi:hypothetical protein
MSDHGFLGETEARLRGALDGRITAAVRIQQFKLVLGVIYDICEVKILCAMFGVCGLMGLL